MSVAFVVVSVLAVVGWVFAFRYVRKWVRESEERDRWLDLASKRAIQIDDLQRVRDVAQRDIDGLRKDNDYLDGIRRNMAFAVADAGFRFEETVPPPTVRLVPVPKKRAAKK